MTAILTGNNRATRDASVPAPAIKNDGSNYRWRMFFDGNSKIADADTLPELIELLIPGYEEKNNDEKFEARLILAANIQRSLRIQIVANLTPDQEQSLTETEKRLIFWNDILDPDADWGEDHIGMWSSDIPLVLLDVNYLPYSGGPKPISSYGDYGSGNAKNIIWLQVADEFNFLTSLTRVGWITFGTPRAAIKIPDSALEG